MFAVVWLNYPLGMSQVITTVLSLFALFSAEGANGGQAEDQLPPASNQVTAADLRQHVEFLSGDELAGRATGSPGLKRAALYLARSLERAGLEPGGDDGGYLQRIELVRIKHEEVPELTVSTTSGEALEVVYGRDFDYYARGEAKSTGELKLIVVSSQADLPAEVDENSAILMDGSRRERSEWLEARGMGAGEGWGLYLRYGSKRPGKTKSEVRGGGLQLVDEAAVAHDPCDILIVRGALREALEAGQVSQLALRVFAQEERVEDQNVIGVIRGVGTAERPELANEAIVLSAHIDHIGVKSDVTEGEDSIYNGADDDASGTAALLEIADAWHGEAAPARTIVFLLATAEEIGLLGTKWYLDHPTVPLQQTVCNLNFEMLGRPDDLVGGAGKLWLTGYDKTNLGPLFNASGLTIVADQRPEENFYQRSDNYAFVMRDVIGQTLSSYNMHKDYHHVSDEADTLDFDHMAIAVRSCVQAVRMLASGEVTPEWIAAPGK